MNSINILISKIKQFYSFHKRLLFTIVPFIIFIFIVFYLFSAQKNLPSPIIKQQNTTKVLQSPEQNEASPQTQTSLFPNETPETSSNAVSAQEVSAIATGKLKFTDGSKSDENHYAFPDGPEGSIGTKMLSDGSTEYKYPSHDPNRPDIQIIKDTTVIFRRKLMQNAPLSDYSEFLTNPPYAIQGSAYYGSNAIILANPISGIAVVYNPDSDQVYEQYLFQSVSVSDYIKKYGNDISDFNPAH